VAFADYAPLAGESRYVLGAFPTGFEFFCSAHAPAAKKLVHLPVRTAVGYLRWDEFSRVNHALPPPKLGDRRCVVCGKENGEGAGWIEFAGDHDRRASGSRFGKRLSRRRLALPRQAWFCAAHADYGRSLADLPTAAALGLLL
jgi:hypothetical protein